MTTLLLDASVLLAAFDLEDGHHEPARALLEDDQATLATLDLARYEVVNVVVRAWRAPESVAPLLAAIEKLADDGSVFVSTGALLTRAAELAERHTISAYELPTQPPLGTPDIVSSAATSVTWSQRILRNFLRWQPLYSRGSLGVDSWLGD